MTPEEVPTLKEYLKQNQNEEVDTKKEYNLFTVALSLLLIMICAIGFLLFSNL